MLNAEEERILVWEVRVGPQGSKVEEGKIWGDVTELVREYGSWPCEK